MRCQKDTKREGAFTFSRRKEYCSTKTAECFHIAYFFLWLTNLQNDDKIVHQVGNKK